MSTSRLPPSPPQAPAEQAALSADTPLPDQRPELHHYDDTPLSLMEREASGRLTFTVSSAVFGPDQPPVALTFTDLQDRLLQRGLSQEAKDRVWRHLGQTVRAERGDWHLFAIGMAQRLLRKNANRLTAGRSLPWIHQIHFSIATEFLLALHRLDLTTPYVLNRLVDVAYTQATGRKRRHAEAPLSLDQIPRRQTPASRYGNPETNADQPVTEHTVLDDLIKQVNDSPGRARITSTQAALIARTHLDGERLHDVATDFGLSEPSASKQRSRAIALIAQMLGRSGQARRAPAEPTEPTKTPEPVAGRLLSGAQPAPTASAADAVPGSAAGRRGASRRPSSGPRAAR